jgi:hypothetical protein
LILEIVPVAPQKNKDDHWQTKRVHNELTDTKDPHHDCVPANKALLLQICFQVPDASNFVTIEQTELCESRRGQRGQKEKGKKKF